MYPDIRMHCSKTGGELLSKWVAEEDISLGATLTCLPALICELTSVDAGEGAAVVAHKDHLGRSVRGALSVSIESTVRAGCAIVGRSSYALTSAILLYPRTCFQPLCPLPGWDTSAEHGGFLHTQGSQQHTGRVCLVHG